MQDPVWLGIDLGTQSVRALVADAEGRVRGRGAAPLTSHRDGDRHEQDPEAWWLAVAAATRQALAPVTAPVLGVATCSTSGTVLLTDAAGNPRSTALMYDDGRAGAQARVAQAAGAAVWERLGHQIQPTWALAKAMWLVDEHDVAGTRLAHQADFVNGRLTGRPVATDSSHALKTGYDVLAERWPAEVVDGVGAGIVLPDVVRPGALLGEVGAAAASQTGIPRGTPVVAGMTDGCASQIGSGALRIGRWNSALGTTLVLKGVTADPLFDPAGLVYSHRSPDGSWLPGAASSVGAGALGPPSSRLADLDAAAAARGPSGLVAYPLAAVGERFPFLAPDAHAFLLGEPRDEVDRHAAVLEGVALVERLALAYVRRLGAPVEGPIAFTGGATRSAYWCQLRADVLGRPAQLPRHADAALGMAILAAYGTGRSRPLADVAEAMVRIDGAIEPRPELAGRFTEAYVRLVDELAGRGWLPADVAAYAREHA